MESEEQLENLVRELKAMSQTKYPTTNALFYQQQQQGSSSCSFNGTLNNQDFRLAEEIKWVNLGTQIRKVDKVEK